MSKRRTWSAASDLICVAAALLLSALTADAQEAQWSPLWDALTKRSDAKVVDGVNDKGKATRRIDLSSGVSFFLERDGDRIMSTGFDNSGRGAVQCSWEIYVGVRAYTEACQPSEDQAFEADLDDAIARMNEFIVENSIVPVTKSELQDAIRQRKQHVGDVVRGQSDDDRRKLCEANPIRPMSIALRSASHDLRVSTLNTLLSVKRPPVKNPCL
ncbi:MULTISPECIES: hypothetical protein [unclassified Bradyrhizobium]|uniref:hypothetical protein n=1 Tax=unclassified Bradyrhizobium TaxID=2631580 RepID=UPI001CD67D45|nr:MULTISPECIES: hypothetical protein [unclassified Bradyrhizobium]MCA1427350.1 hypothetical protein [Bradyrhizobium sp. NBAIM16]MCA1472945.1 hypothetical protein [Bradyrhizobium sp. IC3195]MCA1506870.1 hypothetical protein [Bradyrhizobium sp. NBAIM02]MCA1549419.1 hypothetical protein [Bradyrhizobium sp. BRP19]